MDVKFPCNYIYDPKDIDNFTSVIIYLADHLAPT